MLNDDLGADKEFYRDNIKKIDPNLNLLSKTKFIEHLERICKGNEEDEEIDKYIHAILSEKVDLVGGAFKEKKKIQAAYIDVDAPKKCPECNSKSLITDYKKAEIFCADCGLVIAENFLFVGGGEELRYVPTSVGLLEDDVKSLYKSLSRAGFIRYGQERNMERVILFLIMLRMFHYGCAESLKGAFSIKDKGKSLEGFIRVFKKFGIKIPTYTFDKYEMIIFDVDFLIANWAASFKLSDEVLAKSKYEDVRRVISRFILAGWLMKGKEIHKKLKEQAMEQAEKDIKTGKRPTPYDWITLLCVIYGIRCLKKKKGGEALNPDPALQKIWGIPRKTWKDKWELISSMDEDL